MNPDARARSPFARIPEAAWSIACDTDWPSPPRPNHDKSEIVDPPYHGAPFGGFGAGTFARTYRGDFARWHLHTGYHTYRSLPACAQLLAVRRGNETLDAFAIGPEPRDGSLSSWRFRTAGFTYHALYPLSWFEGDAAGGALLWRITQLSPILPHNYRETSLPVALFRIHLHNTSSKPLEVRAGTSFENLSITAPGDPPPGSPVHARSDAGAGTTTLWMGRNALPHLTPDDGAFALAASGGEGHVIRAFDPSGDGEDLWCVFSDDRAPGEGVRLESGDRAAGAVAIDVTVGPGETREATFSLAWHFPVITFGSGRRWYRRHTRFYVRGTGTGAPDDPAVRIAQDALRLADFWIASVRAWQAPFLESRPPSLARTLFNSLYILADGGTAWEAGEAAAANPELEPALRVPGTRDVGRFSVLECFTYPYYATLDVRYYGSLPLLYFWPELERQVLLQFAAAASTHDAQKREMLHVREVAARKRPGTLPHDLGTPDEDPWVKVNAYDDIDPNRWKDLGPKFVLLVARYLAAVGWEDRGFLRGAWPAVVSAMDALEKQDLDGDALPENEGIPDQTFDKWPMSGASAYCGGLAIAAFEAAAELARWAGNPGGAKRYATRRRRAISSLQKKLWLGDSFAYDESPEGRDVVMAGQLSGEWALAMAGFAPAIDPERIRRTLATIWSVNGAVSGGRPIGLRNGAARAGDPEPDNRHAGEVWPGINYPVAALLVLHGMGERAMTLVDTLARVTFDENPFAFMTPEAWDASGRFRGALYMRALSAWSVEEALRRVSLSPGLESFLVAHEGGTP